MLPTGLECLSYNLNRKNNSLRFFEFGKTYSKIEETYIEKQNLALYFTGNRSELNWNVSSKRMDIYFVKGICNAVLSLSGIKNVRFEISKNEQMDNSFKAYGDDVEIAIAGSINKAELEKFSIKQPVFFLCIDWEKLIAHIKDQKIIFKSIARFPKVQRDLSIITDKKVSYLEVEDLVKSLQLSKLESILLFDVFEDEKLGNNKKSLALNFTFTDKEKTLTDKEIENWMDKIMNLLETKLNAVIRRNA
jgi:phenylalanyl-tRNA synthetase beta chain